MYVATIGSLMNKNMDEGFIENIAMNHHQRVGEKHELGAIILKEAKVEALQRSLTSHIVL